MLQLIANVIGGAAVTYWLGYVLYRVVDETRRRRRLIRGHMDDKR